MTYDQPEDSTAVLEYENTVEYEDEKWTNRIYITQTLGGHYKLFIKTKVVNTQTEKKRETKSWSTLLHERGWTLRNVFGMKKFRKADLPDINHNIDRQVEKLAKKSNVMKSEEELIDEISGELKNKMDDVTFEDKVEEARN